MKLHLVCLAYLCLFPAMARAEIWAYQIHGKYVADCKKRPEASIDEAWNNLEKKTGLHFDIARDTMLMPGYILQNKEQNREFAFYPSKHACEFEREGIAALLSGDQKRLQQLGEKLTKEDKLAAMSPADLPTKQRQDWVNFFAGCTNGVLQKRTPLKGLLQNVIDVCDCSARKMIKLEEKGATQDAIRGKLTEIVSICERETR